MNNTLVVEFWRSEMMGARCVAITEEFWPEFRKAIEATGVNIDEKELRDPFGPIANYHQMRTVIDAVFEVQGMKRLEGQSIIPAIESLVAKYAEIK